MSGRGTQIWGPTDGRSRCGKFAGVDMIGGPERWTISGMRVLLLTASGLVFALGAILYVLSEDTDRFFAWTIKVPLTAAFLGAAYLASGLAELAAARSRTWAYARLSCPPVLIFATITLWVTVVHHSLFHFGPASPLTARSAAWVWLAVYAAFPIAMTVMLVVQHRAAGADPPRLHRLSRWVKGVLAAQAAVMTLAGIALLFWPTATGKVWPWPLTVLTAQAIGAWGVGLGLGVAQAIWEDDWPRLRAATPIYSAFGALGLIAMMRYAKAVDWHGAAAWILVTLLASLLVGGLYARRRVAKVRTA
jgi:hypothetical protein